MMYRVRREAPKGLEILHLQGTSGLPRLSMIPAAGAYVYSWAVAAPSGRPTELIFPGDLRKAVELKAGKVLAGFPFLFPFANRVFQDGKEGVYTWEGKRYEMPIHGFSSSTAWTAASTRGGATGAEVVLALEDSEATRQLYPWRFRVELTYQLQNQHLIIDQLIENRSESAMPLSPGWHPYFRVPLTSQGSKGACVLRIPARTELGIDPQTCGMNGQKSPFRQQEMTLAEHGAMGKYTTDLNDPRVSLQDPSADMGIEMDLSGPDGGIAWPYVLTWTLSDDAPFFCIEPYEGVTDAVHNRIGLRLLAPGQAYRTRLRVRALTK